ncbi:MAG TPA: hypothetical protein VFV97_09275 [Rhodanobacteraceae bacterium]|nr:hypothetical protein [Rhodanobacteraceae bacterium]
MAGIDAAYIAAWLLPALVGSGVWIVARGVVRAPADVVTTVGAGWLIGIVIAAGCARFAAATDTAHAFAHAWPWCAAIGVAAWIGAIARLRGQRLRFIARPEPLRVALRVVWWLLLVWIVMRLALLGNEASLRPVFPWDGWSAWAVKPKTWFLLGHAEPYVSMLDWLANPQLAVRTVASWGYPELLAWIELWFASAAGAWNEPLVDVAWCGALVAFSLAAYGYWRALGLQSWLALALVYVLVSLPLIDAHVALAGYADLWLALTLGLATLAWVRWMIEGERGQLALAACLALCLPAIKLEGTVWLLTFGAVIALDLLPRRWRWPIVGGLAVVTIVAIAAGAVGPVSVTWNSIEIPSLGTFAIAWHGVGSSMVASLFTLPNWHLFWYAVPVLFVMRRQRFGSDRAARMLGLMLLLDFVFLFVLFFLTTASTWAQDFTSANRLILQLVPSVIVLAATLLRPLPGDAAVSAARLRTAEASTRPSVPA